MATDTEIEAERAALRALVLSPTDILPDYSGDEVTARRVGIALRAHTGSWSSASQRGLEKSLDGLDKRHALTAYYRAKSRQCAKMATAFPEDSGQHLADMKGWDDLMAAVDAGGPLPV